MIYSFVKDINSDKLKAEIAAAGLAAPNYITTVGTSIEIDYTNELSVEQAGTLSAVVAAHVKLTTAESLQNYLNVTVFPFVQGLISQFAAENISMGITQAGKTGHVLSLFSKKYPVPSAEFQNCLKDSFDTGSLYVSISIIQYIRDNPSEFSELSPFVTDARLLSMKNKIEAFLGLAISV